MKKQIETSANTTITVHLVKEDKGLFFVFSTETITQQLPHRHSSMTNTKDSLRCFGTNDEAKEYFNELITKYGGEVSLPDCKCDNPQCAKCLSVNCKDESCPTHTREAKMAWRKRWELENDKPSPYPKNF